MYLSTFIIQNIEATKTNTKQLLSCFLHIYHFFLLSVIIMYKKDKNVERLGVGGMVVGVGG